MKNEYHFSTFGFVSNRMWNLHIQNWIKYKSIDKNSLQTLEYNIIGWWWEKDSPNEFNQNEQEKFKGIWKLHEYNIWSVRLLRFYYHRNTSIEYLLFLDVAKETWKDAVLHYNGAPVDVTGGTSNFWLSWLHVASNASQFL